MIVDQTIEAYLHQLQPSKDPVLQEMEKRAEEQKFPIIGPLVGRFCQMLAQSINAKDIFEMGSGFGYSTWYFAQAVGDGGRVVHTDADPKKSADARAYLKRAGLHTRVQFEGGDALEAIKKYPGPFDVVFIDVDKTGYPEALELARSRVRVGGYLITDNVLWSGRVTQPKPNAETKAILKYTHEAFDSPDLYTTILPLRDGVAVSLKVAPEPKRRR